MINSCCFKAFELLEANNLIQQKHAFQAKKESEMEDSALHFYKLVNSSFDSN